MNQYRRFSTFTLGLAAFSQLLVGCGEPSHRGTTQIIQGFDQVSSLQLGLDDTGRGGTLSATVPARVWSSNAVSSMKQLTFTGGIQAVQARGESGTETNAAQFAHRGTLTNSDTLAQSYVMEVGCQDSACDRVVIAGPVRRSQAQGAPSARLSSQATDTTTNATRVQAALFERGRTQFELRRHQTVSASQGAELNKALEVFSNPILPHGDRAEAASLTDH